MDNTSVFLTPLLIVLPEARIDLGSGISIQKQPAVDFTALHGWDPLIGEELIRIEEVPCWLTYEYESSHAGGPVQISDFMVAEYAMIALQILAPVGARGVRVTCRKDGDKLTPRSVGRGHLLSGTKWSYQAAYELSRLTFVPLMVERLSYAVRVDIQRVVNSVALYLTGLNSENARIRTLLWTMALDALAMASNASQFRSRLEGLLGRETPIFPARKDGVRPKYVVSDVTRSLYDFRSEVAHGRSVSNRFFHKIGFEATSGTTIVADYTLEQLLEEAALFMLNGVLQKVLTTELFLEIAVDSGWRRRLKSGGGQTQA